MAAKSMRCSLPVRLSQSTSNWGHTPIMGRTASMPAAEAMLSPYISASPAPRAQDIAALLLITLGVMWQQQAAHWRQWALLAAVGGQRQQKQKGRAAEQSSRRRPAACQLWPAGSNSNSSDKGGGSSSACVPEVSGSTPVRQLMVVDLPAPLGPSRQKHSPAKRSREGKVGGGFHFTIALRIWPRRTCG